MSDPVVADLTIDSIAAGGDGVGRSNGLVAFVPRSAPGDRLRARLSVKKGFARGEIEALLEPSSRRVDPPCAHYVVDRCGGCQIQHLSYGAQIDAKRAIIRDGLERIGRRSIDLPVVDESPAQWRYRTKLTLAFRRQGGRWIAGLHPYDDPVGVFSLSDCPISDPRVLDIVRDILAQSTLLPKAATLRVAVRLLDASGDRAAAVVEGGDRWPAAEQLFAKVARLSALWWKPEHRARTLVASRQAEKGSSAFAQINPAVARQLQAHVVDRVLAHAPSRVVDAYAGVGDTAARIADAGVAVVAIELDRDAAARASERLSAPSAVVAGRVEERLEEHLPADVVVLNPPRTGVHPRVTDLLAAQPPGQPRAIIYVSCNPATLGRDVARLPGFRVAAVRGFDMFPQTAHVESVCELVPQEAA